MEKNLKPGKKAQKKLEKRLQGYQEIMDRNKGNSKVNEMSFKRPGSRNPRK